MTTNRKKKNSSSEDLGFDLGCTKAKGRMGSDAHSPSMSRVAFIGCCNVKRCAKVKAIDRTIAELQSKTSLCCTRLHRSTKPK